jgi:type II restriction enzyme
MDLEFDLSLAKGYKSQSQISRVLTEGWTKRTMYCPICGNNRILKCKNNDSNKDFRCEKCGDVLELKSRKTPKGIGKTITGADYDKTMECINSTSGSHFLLMTRLDDRVNNLVLIPKCFFTPEMIKKRTETTPKGRGAPWIGCNIDVSGVPDSGRIYIVEDGRIINKKEVLAKYARARLSRTDDLKLRGWTLDVLTCIEKIPEGVFPLSSVYSFADQLKAKHPKNNHVKEKICQQLQILRDRGFIEFIGNGNYRITEHLAD